MCKGPWATKRRGHNSQCFSQLQAHHRGLKRNWPPMCVRMCENPDASQCFTDESQCFLPWKGRGVGTLAFRLLGLAPSSGDCRPLATSAATGTGAIPVVSSQNSSSPGVCKGYGQGSSGYGVGRYTRQGSRDTPVGGTKGQKGRKSLGLQRKHIL